MKINKLLFFLLFIACAFEINAQDSEDKNHSKIISMFIYNMPKNIEQPKHKNLNEEYVITIIGTTELSISVYENLFETYIDKDVNGRKIRIKQVNTIKELENSDLIFYTEKEKLDIKELNKKIGKYPTIHTGYMLEHDEYTLNFILHHNKLSFTISEENCAGRKFKPSEAVLKMSIKE